MMEKEFANSPALIKEHRCVNHNRKRTFSLFLLSVGVLLFLGYRSTCHKSFTSVDGSTIKWTPCGDNIDCGRLTVPMDYHTLRGTANLAVARYRATNTTAKLGTLFINPGGPGGSGVSFVYRAAPKLSAVLEGRYDIVSWDPRGVNETTPRVECFHSQTAQDLYYAHTHQETQLEGRNLTDPIDLAVFTADVRKADAVNAALAKRCIDMSGEVLSHVGTATVVRDLEFLSRMLQGPEEPIHFWGFSYGTIIGNYFVNMFPERVGRVIIDGVVDPELWANSPSNSWYKFDYVDTDRAFDNFVKACAEAGPNRCALAHNNSTPESISTQIDNFIDDLYDYPLPVPVANRPGALTSGMVRGYIFTSMYSPRTWPQLAEYLAAGIRGNGTSLMNNVQDNAELDPSVKAQTAQAITAVTCVDTPPYPPDVDKAAVLQKNIDETILTYTQTSKRFAALELDLCHHWTPRETERFTGPFNSSLANEILVIGNTADPITPVVNAKTVNRLLKNDSRLVIQDGSGHCSLAMGSLCTGRIIRNYFLHGRLPVNGVVCPTNETLFPPSGNDTSVASWMSEDVDDEDKRLLEDLKAFGQEMQPFLARRRW